MIASGPVAWARSEGLDPSLRSVEPLLASGLFRPVPVTWARLSRCPGEFGASPGGFIRVAPRSRYLH